MTVAERMRKDGWRQYANGMWVLDYQGSECVVMAVTSRWRFGAIAINQFRDRPQFFYAYEAVGLRDLAQRAKAAARRLARKGRA